MSERTKGALISHCPFAGPEQDEVALMELMYKINKRVDEQKLILGV
jgi:hypothetical protein